MNKFKPSINGLKGYNFQGTVYSYFVCLMDLKREISELDAEVSAENNFDDIFVKTKEDDYYFQIKNFLNVQFEKITFEKKEIIVNGQKINVENDRGYKKNVLLIKDLSVPKDRISCNLFGFDCYEINQYYIAGYNEDEINNKVKNMYVNDNRYNDVLLLADRILNSGNFKIKIEDLPKLYLFEQKLQQETALIRHFSLDSEKKQICIVGNPGTGKSHLVNELEMNGVINNCIIERLWISEDDKDKYERIKFDYFLRDLNYMLFGKAELMSEDKIIEKLKIDDKTLVIDGLDHVENYNKADMEKFLNFISKISDSKLVVMTRPLKSVISLETIELGNWSSDESDDYLKYIGINDYEISRQIFKICKGYPIITFYLSQHYLDNGVLPEIEEINSVIEFYDSLMKDDLPELSVFLINDYYFKKNELKELLGDREYKVIEKILNNYKYLFNVRHDRIYFIHDSLNYYLRSKELDYLEINKDVIEKILNSINNDDIKYLTRFRYFHISDDNKISIVKKICKFSYLNSLLSKTFDYEAIQMIYNQVEQVISINKDSFNIYEYYEFILIIEVLKRDHHIGFYSLILERLKYYIKNDLISFDTIYSSGVLYGTYSLIVEGNDKEIEAFFKNTNFDVEGELNSLYEKGLENKNYFNILYKDIVIDEYIKNNINNQDEYHSKDRLIYLLSYLYIKKIKYKGYEEIPKYLIENENQKAIEKCTVLFKIFNIRTFFVNSFLKKLKDYLFSLGIDVNDNYYKYKTLKEVIIGNSELGSFWVNDYVCNYIRLANFENRKIDIYSAGLFYFMYYNRKDYSMYFSPQALCLFVKKGYLTYLDAIKIIAKAMDMSEKGIRTIMTDFYNLIPINDFKILNMQPKFIENSKLIISDLKPERINIIDEKIVLDYFFKNIFRRHYKKNIDYDDLGFLLKSKYKNYILKCLDLYDFKIDGILIKDFDIGKYKKNEEKSVFMKDRNYIRESDTKEIIKLDITCIELAKYVDGWYNSLPYVNLFEIYSKETLKENIIDIIHNACFGYKIYDMYAARFPMVGNYLLLLEMCEMNIDFKKFYNIFCDFLKISLITM